MVLICSLQSSDTERSFLYTCPGSPKHRMSHSGELIGPISLYAILSISIRLHYDFHLIKKKFKCKVFYVSLFSLWQSILIKFSVVPIILLIDFYF